jgi:hypothetical protein
MSWKAARTFLGVSISYAGPNLRKGSRAVRSHRHSAEQFPRSKFRRKNLRKNPAKNFRKKSADRIPEKIRRTSRALPSEVAPIIDAGTPQSRDGQVGNASQVQR